MSHNTRKKVAVRKSYCSGFIRQCWGSSLNSRVYGTTLSPETEALISFFFCASYCLLPILPLYRRFAVIYSCMELLLASPPVVYSLGTLRLRDSDQISHSLGCIWSVPSIELATLYQNVSACRGITILSPDRTHGFKQSSSLTEISCSQEFHTCHMHTQTHWHIHRLMVFRWKWRLSLKTPGVTFALKDSRSLHWPWCLLNSESSGEKSRPRAGRKECASTEAHSIVLGSQVSKLTSPQQRQIPCLGTVAVSESVWCHHRSHSLALRFDIKHPHMCSPQGLTEQMWLLLRLGCLLLRLYYFPESRKDKDRPMSITATGRLANLQPDLCANL